MQHPPLDYQRMITKDNPEFVVENIEKIAQQQQEPEWMKQSRLDSFQVFQQLPMPGRKDEEWRKTDISGLEYDRFRPMYNGYVPQTHDLPESLQTSAKQFSESPNVLVRLEGQTIESRLSEELAAKGVIFADLKRATREHPELVQRFFARSKAKLEEDKFGSLHTAFWNSGIFVYVPRNVQVNLPLHIFQAFASCETAHFPRTIIALDEGAELTYYEERTAAVQDKQLFVDSTTEIFLENTARLNYIQLQDFPSNAYNFSYQKGFIGRDANLNWFVGTFGGKVTKSVISSVLQQPGAQTQMLGASIGDKGQFIDQNTHQIHDAPNTTSDLLFKNAIKKSGYSLYRGTIQIAKHAQKSDAYQTNRNLMLGEGARSESIPALEIIANDVKCSHGASVSKIDPQQLFYLRSRGLHHETAVRLVIEGFFDALLQKIADEKIAEHLREKIYQKTLDSEILESAVSEI